jgi:protein tyrosine/serine phosphatase
MTARVRWVLIVGLMLLLTVVPFYYYRSVYEYGKRFRVVSPGVFYRSGQLTQEGFEDFIRRNGIRTVINAQDEYPDPDLPRGYWDHHSIKETQLCERLGVRYVFLPPDLISRRRLPDERPAAIERFLALLDDPNNLPVLLHCKAGLHRTGVLTAVFRMEYEGWTPAQAMTELRACGFGEFVSSAANDYIQEYILSYRRGHRTPPPVAAER